MAFLLNTVRRKTAIELFLRPIQRITRGLYAVVSILHRQADDVQKLSLVEWTGVLRRLAPAVGDGETLSCQPPASRITAPHEAKPR